MCEAQTGAGLSEEKRKKDFIEWYIVEQTIEYVLTPERIEFISDRIIKEYDKEFNDDNVKAMEHQIVKIDREIRSIVDTLIKTNSKNAIDIINDKLEALDLQKADLEIDLAKLRVANKIRFKREDIVAWLKQFCKGDLFDMEFRQRIIDTFVNSIYLYDDKLIIYYNIKDSKQITYVEMLENTDLENLDPLNSSDLMRNGSPINNLSEHISYIFIKGLFGAIIVRG